MPNKAGGKAFLSNTLRYYTALILVFVSASFASFSQGSPEYGSGIKINLNQEGTRYIRFINWGQIWFRSQQNNPGSLINGEVKNKTWDIGARRLRVITYAQISPRYL
ncbi:MAG TPA: hypothetical protein PK977_00160, partial [Chitinophagaceae bacterium]|nr:hypothetical protein [Chitinophagaceae bacterium]